MGSVGLTPEDFKRLPKDGARFEALVCQLLEAMGYRILEKPAVGTEGGRDVLVERTLKDQMVERREKVIVQCKHYAHSGRSIGDHIVGVWQNAMTRYKARGYLLVTDTRPTEKLSGSFRKFSEDGANYPSWSKGTGYPACMWTWLAISRRWMGQDLTSGGTDTPAWMPT